MRSSKSSICFMSVDDRIYFTDCDLYTEWPLNTGFINCTDFAISNDIVHLKQLLLHDRHVLYKLPSFLQTGLI